jgi:cation transport regulator ChaC
MSGIAIFAYGSLVSPDSFEQTLGRRPSELYRRRLGGWRRRWSVVRDNLAAEKTFARHPGGELPRWVVGLNIERDASAGLELAPNGAMIEVDEFELERLDLREMRYQRVEVTDAIEDVDRFERVVAYTARPQHFAPQPPADAVRMAPYLRALEAAYRDLGEGQWELFLQTTEGHPGETIEPILVRDRIPPGNPREW